MRFDQSPHDAVRALEHRRKLAQRAERRYQREAFAGWASDVQRHAEKVGVTMPTSAELSMLKRLAEMDGPFSAGQVVRNGWCGIRTASDATKALERFVGNGWLHPALPNREGQARYAFTREHALGTLPTDARPFDSLEIWQNVDAGMALVEAEFLHISEDADEWDEKPVAECGFCEIPDQTTDADIWAMARKLAHEEGTMLHKIADRMDGLSPIHKAYAMAIAQDRIMGSDKIKTHIRGIADYLGVDYNALRTGIAAAVAAIQNLNGDNVTSSRGQSRDSNADD